MPSVFTRVIEGELPGRFVWRDETCVAFLSINPLAMGHTLVVPREEVDHWLDLEPPLSQHLFAVAQSIGKGIQRALSPEKVGLIIAGLEVAHVHLHLVPINSLGDLDFKRQEENPDPQRMDEAAEKVRAALRELGMDRVAE